MPDNESAPAGVPEKRASPPPYAPDSTLIGYIEQGQNTSPDPVR
jgi:hypothetical protein